MILKLAVIQRVTKIIKSTKDYSYRERLKKFGLTIGKMVRVFANSPGERDSIPGRVIPKTQKWYLIPSCLTLGILRYGSRVSRAIQRKVSFPTSRCSRY